MPTLQKDALIFVLAIHGTGWNENIFPASPHQYTNFRSELQGRAWVALRGADGLCNINSLWNYTTTRA